MLKHTCFADTGVKRRSGSLPKMRRQILTAGPVYAYEGINTLHPLCTLIYSAAVPDFY